jgi:hypothetical protein
VASGEEQNKEGSSQGFAGLSSMVSDVNMTIELPEQKNQNKPEPSNNNPQPRATSTKEKDVHKPSSQTYQEPIHPRGVSSGGKWLLVIGVVIGFIWLVGESGSKKASSPSSYKTSGYPTAPSTQTPISEPQLPRRPSEEMPPVGRDLVLRSAQIRFCVAEDIRMEAAKQNLDNYNDYDVQHFNTLIANYNSRCGAFRYRSGALKMARSDIEPFRFEIEAEGRNYFAEKSQSNSGYPSTTIEEVMEQGKTVGVQGKENAYSFDEIMAQGKTIAPAPDQLDPQSISTDLSELSDTTRESIESACSPELVNGQDAYNSCLFNELN